MELNLYYYTRKERTMYVLRITNSCIENIINSLVISDGTRELIKKLVSMYEESYIGFVHCLFTIYTVDYIEILDDNSPVSRVTAKSIIDQFNQFNCAEDVTTVGVLVADVYDLFYRLSAHPYIIEYSKFKTHLYEDVFDDLESIVGPVEATNYLEEVFFSIEYIVQSMELSILSISNRDTDTSSGCCLYLQLNLSRTQLLLNII